MTDSRARCPCGVVFVPDRTYPPRESLDGQPLPRLCEDCEEMRAQALYARVLRGLAKMDDEGERRSVRHTPGPWILAEESERVTGTRVCIHDVTCRRIADVIPWRGPGTEVEANARLIAAAPDLLSALKRAAPGISELHAQGIECPDCLPEDGEQGQGCPLEVQIEAALKKAALKKAEEP